MMWRLVYALEWVDRRIFSHRWTWLCDLTWDLVMRYPTPGDQVWIADTLERIRREFE